MLAETDTRLAVEEGVVERMKEADCRRNGEDQRLARTGVRAGSAPLLLGWAGAVRRPL
jgi:hypothetical protein